MSKQLFRQKSIDKITSPEQVNDYIRVSNPSVWMILAAVIVLLIGVCVWGMFGSLDTTLQTGGVCKDGQLVLMHNETVNETTTGVGDVSSLTLAQIKSFDMVRNGKVYKDEQNNVAKVPTLLEALKATKDKIYVNLDLAGKNNVPAKVLEAIYEAGVEDQVMLFASGDIAEYQKLNPLVAVHPYVNSVEATSSYSGMIGAKLFQYGNAVYLNNTIPEFGTKMHVKGYLSYSNLLDQWDNALRNGDYTPLDKFIASGSDFVQTDVAELVIKYLDGKGLR